MPSQLYFDSHELNRGYFFWLDEEILTEEGDPYELEDWIGRGANGAVFRCRQRATGEECAIKFLMRSGTTIAERFNREVRLLRQFVEDHSTRYHGVGRVKVKGSKTSSRRSLPFVVMELAECNLQDVMRAHAAPLNYEDYAGQFRGLAGALATLHDLAVHRDIKPENILVVGERWLLSDYGLCTFVNPEEDDLSTEGQNIGPKFWLSPEAQNRRLGNTDQINAASDVFQVAAIFWYVVTGRHPSGVLTQDDWTGPKKLFEVLFRSLSHDYTRRPQNGTEFLTYLESALNQ